MTKDLALNRAPIERCDSAPSISSRHHPVPMAPQKERLNFWAGRTPCLLFAHGDDLPFNFWIVTARLIRFKPFGACFTSKLASSFNGKSACLLKNTFLFASMESLIVDLTSVVARPIGPRCQSVSAIMVLAAPNDCFKAVNTFPQKHRCSLIMTSVWPPTVRTRESLGTLSLVSKDILALVRLGTGRF